MIFFYLIKLPIEILEIARIKVTLAQDTFDLATLCDEGNYLKVNRKYRSLKVIYYPQMEK